MSVNGTDQQPDLLPVPKIVIILSDGLPEPSSAHRGKEYNLTAVVEKITKETNQKLIGLGIGPGTEHVRRYYPTSLANVSLKEMADNLATLIREVIANSDQL